MVALKADLPSVQGSETLSGLSHAIPPSETHIASNGSGAITVPDARLLFGGDYKQSGLDLILSKDGHDFTIHDYFRDARHADLRSPDGARLNASIVDALTAGHTQYAQAGGASEPAKVIGQVTKLTGSATAIRNGVAVELNAGDNVMKGDVVQAGPSSQLSLTFVDGTVFGLSSNARMVLNEMIYDPNGSSNASLLSLVQGTLTFVAGETARHGDMKIDTPVATMGIRGTAAIFELGFELTGPNAQPMRVQMIVEPGAVVGSIVMLDRVTGQQVGPPFNQKALDYFINVAGIVTTQSAPPPPPETKALVDLVMGLYFGGAYNPNPDAANPKTDNPTHGSTPATPLVPAGPSGDSHTNNDTTNTNQPTILHIEITKVDTGTTRSLDLVIDNPPKITVVNVFDKSFLIADQVTIVDPDPDIKTPYMTGSAALGSIVSNASFLPPGLDFSTLIHIDKDTGQVSYDVKDFAFLGVNEHVIYTVNFVSASGPVQQNESVTLTIDGANDQPVISGVDHATVTERTVLTGTILTDVASGTLTVSDVDREDTHAVTNKLVSAVGSNGTIVPAKTLADLAAALQTQIQGDNHGGQATLAWNFGLADHDLDFLAKGEKLTVQYQLVVTDSSGASNASSAPETLTLTLFANNVPIITSSAQSGTVTEDADLSESENIETHHQSGAVTFTDIDLNDVEKSSITNTVVIPTLANGYVLTQAERDALVNAFTIDAATHSNVDGSGSIGWHYDIADSKLDFLGSHDQVVLQYTVQVDDHNGGTAQQVVTITVHGAEDVPIINSTAQAAAVTEDADLSPNENKETHTQSGAVTFSDADLSDEPTSSITNTLVAATLANGDVLTQGERAALVNAFTIDPVTFNSTSGTGSIGWHYNIADSTLDFLGKNDQVVLTYTVQVDDHNGGVKNQDVTITVHGSEDAPVITSSAQSGTIVTGSAANASSGTVTFGDADLFDRPASSIVVADTTVTAKLANGHQLTQAQHDLLVNAFTIDPAAFNAANGTGSVGWHYSVNSGALAFLGANDQVVLKYTVQVDDHNGGVATQDVVIAVDGSKVTADVAPVIDTTSFTLSHSGSSTTIKGLAVTDVDTSSGELYGLTAHADSGTVVPGAGSGSLDQINSMLSSGVTYTSPATPPETDKVTMTVTDGFNKFATVNFIFQEGTPPGNHVTLDGTGTAGKDVIFSSGYDDTMIGNGQGDQFVFQNGAPVGGFGNGHDVITNFTPGTDKIDLRFYSGTPDAGALAAWLQQHATSANNGADTLLDLDQNQTGADTVLLKNVALANLHASDFIVHS